MLKCDYSNESYLAVLSKCSVYHTIKGGSKALIRVNTVTIKIKATEQHSPVLFIVLHKVVLSFESEDDCMKCEHLVIKGIGTVYFALQGTLSPSINKHILLSVLHTVFYTNWENLIKH